MSQNSFARLLSIVVLLLGVRLVSASVVTYEVGTCKAHLPTYSSISAALAATPAPNVVQVCPGIYNEQVQITHPVTLEGLSAANSDQVIIAIPSAGLVTNAAGFYAQLWIDNAAGPVNISNITVDGAGGVVPNGSVLLGIGYQNSSGTVNRVATRNQTTPANGGWGIFVLGGTSNPTVTIENSSIHEFNIGIVAESNSDSSELAATIKANELTSSFSNATGIFIAGGATTTVTNNFIGGTNLAIETWAGATGSVSGNILMNDGLGILADADEVPITSNKIFNNGVGITVATSAVEIHGNSIANSRVAIEFDCSANENIHSNTITDAGTALHDVPLGLATTNSYFNVGTLRTGGCS